MAMGKLWEAVLAVYGSSKPIGLLRGSCWHAQNVRRNLPFLPGETLAQVDDVNQANNSWCYDAGFGQPYQTNALAFSCDILRGAGIGFLINEVDGMKVNFTNMDPPQLPHDNPVDFDDEQTFQLAVKNRALICLSRGVSFMVTHFRYSNSAHLPEIEKVPPFLTNWMETLSDEIGTHLADEPLVPTSPVSASPSDIAGAISDWESAGGGPSTSVPLNFF